LRSVRARKVRKEKKRQDEWKKQKEEITEGGGVFVLSPLGILPQGVTASRGRIPGFSY
jgi:hypothetical protein